MTREELSRRIERLTRAIEGNLEELKGCPGGVSEVGRANAAAVMILDQERAELRRQLRAMED
jgi:hypothetical protein